MKEKCFGNNKIDNNFANKQNLGMIMEGFIVMAALLGVYMFYKMYKNDQKAVYLLFLNHPEGILFKHLPDYREELTEIYVKLKPYGMSDRAIQSIEDVTNPLLNSINEKCARIRGAFVGQFDDHLARHYYIDGLRGEAKKIALPRELVVWE